MLLVVTYSRAARQTLRNVVRTYEETTVERLGRAALLAETELGALLALRLREKHDEDVLVERTGAFNEFADVPETVRTAATAYEARETPSLPYDAFAADRGHPTTDDLRERPL